MFYFQLLAVVAVFGAIAWLATGRGGQVGDTYPDRPDVALPDDRQLRKDDVDAARFTVGWRGYRMDEVDAVLDRLANELEYRDRLIAELLPPGGMAALGMPPYGSDLDFQPASRAVADGVATAQPGMDPGTDPAFTSTEVVETGNPYTGNPYTTATDDDEVEGGPDDENPLSRWYRKPQ